MLKTRSQENRDPVSMEVSFDDGRNQLVGEENQDFVRRGLISRGRNGNFTELGFIGRNGWAIHQIPTVQELNI